MSDGTTLNAMSGGDTIVTETVGGAQKIQVVKVATGAADTYTDVSSSNPMPVSGTVTANVGTTNGLAADTSVNGLLVAQGSTTSGEKGPLAQGAVTTSAPSYTSGQTDPLSLDTSGNLRTAVENTVTVIGTVTANAGTNTSTAALAQESGGNLAALAGAVTGSRVQVNEAQVGGTAVATGNGAASAGTQRVTIASDSTGQVTLAAGSAVAGGVELVDAGGANRASISSGGAVKTDGSAVTQPVSGSVTASLADSRPGSGTITAVDSTSSSSSGQNGTLLYTGVPTSGSAYSLAVNGLSGYRVQMTGTWSGTLQFELSVDGGTTWAVTSTQVSGTAYTQSAVTGNGVFLGDCGGATNIRVRATAWTSGTATALATATAAPAVVKINNAVRVVDNTSGQQVAVKPASTAVAAADTAVAVGLHPSSPLPAGSNALGSVTANAGTNLNTSALALETGNLATIAGAVSGAKVNVNLASGSIPAGSAVIGGVELVDSAGSNKAAISAAGRVSVDGSGVTQPVSGTVTANVGTTNGLALDASVNGLLTAQGSTTSGQSGPLAQTATTTAAPTYTTAKTNPLSTDTSGNLRTSVNNTVTVAGTVTANAGTNTSTAALALESGGNLATVAGAVTSSRMQVNHAQVAGTAVSVGNGTTDSGTQRVSLSSDGTGQVKLAAGSALVGSVELSDGTNTANVLAPGTANASGSAVLTGPTSLSTTFSVTTAQATTSTDVGNYRWVSVQITGQGAASTVTWQCSNDNSNWFGCGLESSTATGTQVVLSTAAAAIYHGPLPARYFRLNITGIASGTTSGTVVFSTAPAALQAYGVAAAQTGTWTVQPGNTPNTSPWLASLQPATSGGWLVSSSTALTTTVVAAKASAGQVGGWSWFNPNATAAYVQVFNTASGSVTLGTTVPAFVIPVPTVAAAAVEFANGLAFGTAISYAATTTATGSTAPATALTGFLAYK